jgi:hypothetical protein
MKRLLLALALIVLAVPSATASSADDTAKPAQAPATQGCHHSAGISANVGLDV